MTAFILIKGSKINLENSGFRENSHRISSELKITLDIRAIQTSKAAN